LALAASGPTLAQIRLGDQLGGPSRSPRAGLEGDSQFNDPVTLTAQFTAATADRPAVLMVTADIAPGWHVYSLTQPPGGPTKTKIELTPSPEYQLAGEFRAQPESTSRVDNEVWVGLTIEEHAGEVTWYAPIELAAGVDPASLTIAGQVRMLACKESCIPVNMDFTARLGRGVPIGELASASGGATARTIATTTSPTFQPEGSEVKISARLIPGTARPGDAVRLEITLTPAPNWHIYAYADRDDHPGSKPTLLAFEQISGLKAARPTTATAVTTDDSIPEFGTMRYHQGPVTWEVPITVPSDMKPGEYPITGAIGYQACETRDDGMGSCELPKAAQFQTTLAVGGAAGSAARDLSFTPATYKEAADVAARWASDWKGTSPLAAATLPALGPGSPSTSIFVVLAAALLGGLILNVMPCVLPVIGLKIMAFAEQGGESRRRVFTLNLAYSAGLVSVFLLLATLATLVQLGVGSEDYGWGELYTLLWFKVAMIVLVFAMALSFLGTWEIPIPGFAGSGTAARLATREGFAGAIFKGIFTTILATPCSGPFLGPVFGYTIGQPPWITYLIFLFVGLGMAAPYLVIGAFPALVRRLPRPGAWMATFKELMGFVLLGTSVYLISTIGSEYVIATLTLLVGVWFACWWIGRTELTASDSARRNAWIGGISTAAAIGILAFWLMAPSAAELPWQPYSPAALAKARAEGKTVLVDFTADWCLTCKTNLKFSLNRKDVRTLVDANNVVTLVADWTDGDPTIKHALAELGSRSIPLLAIYPADPAEQVIVLPDLVTSSEVLDALRQAGPSRAASEAMAEVGPAVSPLN
jgi:thiol:disulfide interchange protein/DsbC/DsbD-like thiol-disulfide interchange protein